MSIPDHEKVSYSVIERAARDYPTLPLDIITGLILVESHGWTFARRYEPGFYRRYFMLRPKKKLIGYISKKVSVETEINDRCTSWGLMQVMGETARENGYQGDNFLELLLRPSVCLSIGCAYLQEKVEEAGSLDKGLLAYNGGGDPSYPARVRLCASYPKEQLATFFRF
jgi:hypothetical protein